ARDLPAPRGQLLRRLRKRCGRARLRRPFDPPAVRGVREVTSLEYRLLGPLEVRAGDGPLPLGGRKQRALLALLLLNANRVVSRERLVDELWGDEPPQTAVTTVQVYVSRLRKVLRPEALQTRPSGYLLEAPPEQVDYLRVEELLAAARQAEPEPCSR